MGALGHYLEEEGLATTQISLIRPHTETIQPPRAVWVPFELGRPLGAPNDPAFQERVLLAALQLLEAPAGPILEDFPEEAPGAEVDSTGWACPVSLGAPEGEGSEADGLRESLAREIRELSSWYRLAVENRGRTTFGASGLEPEAIGELLGAFLGGVPERNPKPDVPLAVTLRLAAEDLKAYYFEAVEEQPGRQTPTSRELADWFWGETAAGKVLRAVKTVCAGSEDRSLKMVGMMLLVPIAQAWRE